MKISRSTICIFIEVSAKKKQLKSQFLGLCFCVLSFRRVKNSYLIRSLSKNSNFLLEMLFFCSKHECKKSWKSSTSRTLFWTRTWKKNCDFALFCRKIKINQDLVEMLLNFIDTSRKIHIDYVKIFVTFRISVNFFIFSIAILRVSVGKKNRDLFEILRNFSHYLYVFL